MNRPIWLALAAIVLAAGCGVQTPLEVGTNSLPNATLWQNYKVQLTAEGGTQPVHWSVASGHLPPGVTLSATGVLSGMPLSEGEFDFVAQVSENLVPNLAARSSNLKIKVRRHNGSSTPLAITTTALATGTVHTLYSAVLGATGGTAPYNWNLAAGSLPAGIALNASTGVLAGTPTGSGQFSFTAEVQDSSSPAQSATQQLTISIASATSPLQISTSSLPEAAVQVAYDFTLSATGGTSPYSWSVIGGSLPPGIGLNASSGMLAGTPAASGQFSFTAEVQDSSTPANHYATRALSITVASAAPSLQISTSSLPAGAVQVAYSTTLSATGGTTPYSWSVMGGAFPPGLGLTGSTGAITGTPTQAGAFLFTAQVKDSAGHSASASLSANIAPPASPVVSSISPKSGPTSGGTTVTISGANFATGAAVSFGGIGASSATVVNATQIQAVAPAHIAGTVDVSVQENGQTSTLASSFTYNTLTPTVSGISPNSGPTAGGSQVTITGTNFLAGALVLFGAASASSVTVVSATQIQAVSPANAAGPVNVIVQDPGNVTGSISAGYTYVSSSTGPPTITSVSPTSGAPGIQVTITGTNFVSADTVTFSSSPASSTFVSATQLIATVPNVSAGTYSITVIDPDPASATLNSGFTVTAAPPSVSLLSGCTVSESNSINFGSGGCRSALPSGWTLMTCEGFEGGATHTTCNGSAVSSVGLGYGTSITCSKGHTGSCSVVSNINGQGAGPSLYFGSGSFGTVYISYWEWKDANALMNDELFVTDLRHVVSGSLQQEIVTDRFNSGGFNSSQDQLLIEPQGNHYGNIYGPTTSFGAGAWHQWEVLYHPNTPGNSDGAVQVYLDGITLINKSGVNINGTINMANSGIQIGGNYGKSVWTNNSSRPNAGGACTSAPGQGAEAGFWLGAFNASPINAGNCAPAPPTFNLNQDDIIIMGK